MIQAFCLLVILISSSSLQAAANGCDSSVFSPEGQTKFLQFQLICGLSFSGLLLLKTGLMTYLCHRPGFWNLALRSVFGTILSVLLMYILSFYGLSSLVSFFHNLFIVVAILVFTFSLAATFSDCIFALNWKNRGPKQILLSLLSNLVLNFSSGLAVYLSFFAKVQSFFY